jgi:pimeloyl-ACP methyl ester carboxylesterase
MTRLHVTSFGAGPAVLFLHGMGSSSATWRRCMDQLADRFTVVAVDLLGHGASPVPSDAEQYTRDRTLADIDDVIASIGQPTALVGHSLGGYLSLAHGATRPGVAQALVVLNTGPGFRDDAKREEWNARSHRNAHRFGVEPQVATMNLQADSVVMDHLADMSVPTLVLAGDQDRPEYTGAGQYLERKMPRCRLQVIAGGAHDMHDAEQAPVVAEVIAEFLSGVFAERSGGA